MTRTAIPLLFLPLLSACTPGEPPLAEQYPGAWQTERREDISQTLVRNGVQNCGDMRYKQSAESGFRFRVRCRSSRSVWQAYTVWLDSGEVAGPYPADPELD